MLDYITTDYDYGLLRFLIFIVTFLTFLFLERLIPWRQPVTSMWLRLKRHLSLAIINAAFVRIVFPVVLVGTAISVEKYGIGGLRSFEMPFWLYVTLSVICLDLVMYAQHRLMHQWPLLWRFHRVHHADRQLDVTTGLRFHPIEMGLSMFFKMMGVALVGPPVIAVVIFECLLNASTLFNHSNIELPSKLESILRIFIVTPDMHRIHHSENINEQQSNYGFFISVWDRIFESYRAAASAGPDKVVIGVVPYYQSEFSTLAGMLLMPFITKKPNLTSLEKAEKESSRVKFNSDELTNDALQKEEQSKNSSSNSVSSKEDKA